MQRLRAERSCSNMHVSNSNKNWNVSIILIKLYSLIKLYLAVLNLLHTHIAAG
jgi:hypothetical protein